MLKVYRGKATNVSINPVTHPITTGCWTWFIDPRAVRYNGKTYFGYIDDLGNVKVSSFSDGNAVDTTFTLKAAMEVDDHDNPSILIRDSDKKVLMFYAKHAGSVVYLRISSNSESAALFEAEANLATAIGGTKYTYPNPVQLLNEANDPIYLFYRDANGANATWAYSKSIDGGATWSARTVFYAQDISPYLKICSNGSDRVDFAVSASPNDDAALSIYHFYYSGGNFYKTDGTQITAGLPLASANLTSVFSNATDKTWVWDVARDAATGNIAIAFTRYVSTTDHRYYYALWSGGVWTVNEIVAAGGNLGVSGENYYAGGITVDPANLNTVYLAKLVNGIFEIWKYTTANSGSTWTGTAITTGSKQHNARPTVIRGGGIRYILWWQGFYPGYATYKTQILAGVQ